MGKKPQFLPFSESLTKSLKKLRLYSKAVKAYKRLPKHERELKVICNDLDSCFVFAGTKEGTSYWYDVHTKIVNL